MTEPLERLTSAVLDRYTIEHELGAGGRVTAYLAEDTELNRKIVPERPATGAGRGARSRVCYGMPDVDGESLRERLYREKQLPIDDAQQIAREAADALGSAHRHDVIHRGVKPENILLEEGHAVVAEFGIARAIDVAGGDRPTETGPALGTPSS